MIRLVLALAMVAMLGRAASAEAPSAAPRLKELVTVSAEIVRIGDLVENAGMFDQVADPHHLADHGRLRPQGRPIERGGGLRESGGGERERGGGEGFGTLQQNYLEEGNVQAVTELSSLIAAQRAYEMNSKVITAADDMLAATAQLKS